MHQKSPRSVAESHASTELLWAAWEAQDREMLEQQEMEAEARELELADQQRIQEQDEQVCRELPQDAQAFMTGVGRVLTGEQHLQEAGGAHSMTQPSQDASSCSPELDQEALAELGSEDQ
eukprot:4627058-Alexandrium_andersonii.AAC.1